MPVPVLIALRKFDRMLGGLPASDGGKYLRELVPAVRELWQFRETRGLPTTKAAVTVESALR